MNEPETTTSGSWYCPSGPELAVARLTKWLGDVSLRNRVVRRKGETEIEWLCMIGDAVGTGTTIEEAVEKANYIAEDRCKQMGK